MAYSATLGGTVQDSSGGVMPNVKVTLANPEKGFARSFTTGSDGGYTFTLLSPGTYTLTAEGSGFETYVQRGIVLAVGESATQDITLRVGAVTQRVEVNAAAPMVNTTDSNVAQTVTQREVQELPLNWRNPYGLVALNSSVNNSSQNQVLNAPGTQGTADQDITFFNFGGGEFGTVAFLLDGHWDDIGDWGGTVYVPSVDNTEEFKIQTNAFTADYGWSTANIVNVITKSGTSVLHGDAYEFNRVSAMDANNFFNNAAGIKIPRFARNSFGVTIGGPIDIPKIYHQRDRTFFFAEYEGLRQASPLTEVGTTPSSDMLTGNFSALLGAQIGTDALGRPVLSGQIYNPFSTRNITASVVDPVTGVVATQTGIIRDPIAGNIIPSSMMDPVGKKFAQYYPKPTGPGLVSNFTGSAGAPTENNDYSIRVDHVISDKSNMYTRWSQRFEFKQLAPDMFGTSDIGGPGTIAGDNRWDWGMGYTHVFNPSTVMSTVLGWNRWVETRIDQGFPFDWTTVGLPSYLNASSNQFPSVSVTGMLPLGAQVGSQGGWPREVGTYSADLTMMRGPHDVHFGYMGVEWQSGSYGLYQTSFTFPLGMTQGPNPEVANPATGFGFASLLLGTGNGGSTGDNALSSFAKFADGWYVEDTWKTTRRLTLSLGLRYDFQTPPTERTNQGSWFNFTAANPISQAVGFTVPGELVFQGGGNRRGLYNPQYTNFAPRLGLAYRLSDKLVMRAGYGIFFIPAFRDFGPTTGFSQATPYEGTVDGIHPVNLLGNAFPGGIILPPGKSLGGLTNVGLDTAAVQNYVPSPYMNQWMYGLQYQISPNNLLDVTYFGNHGVKLPLSSYDFNQLPAQDLSLGQSLLNPVTNPYYGLITTSGCGLNAATVPAGQLLRPYPEYCSLSGDQTSGGTSNYNALEVSYTHRWSQGMQFLLSYTASKYLDNTEGPGGWANVGSPGIRDYYDLKEEYSPDANDIPKSFVASYSLQAPYGRGRHFGRDISGPLDAVLGGWQLSGITTAKDGFPLSITAATNNSNSFSDVNTQRPNLVGDPHVANPSVREWFNVNAFAQPAPFTYGNVPRYMPSLRAPGLYDWDITIQKWWSWRERFRLEFRGEMFNAFNHTNFYVPNQCYGCAGFGTLTGALEARDIQFALKLRW